MVILMKDYVDLINSGAYSADEVIRLFYNSFDDDILKEHTSDELEIAGKKFLMFARQRNVDEIVSIIDDGTDLLAITNPANIPQFSSIEVIEKLLPLVEANAGIECNYTLLGYFFNKEADIRAQTKYGENHYKTAMLIGLVKKYKPFDVTPLGRLYMKMSLPLENRYDIKKKLYLRIPLIRYIMLKARKEPVNVYEIMSNYLADSTVKRRISNVRLMVDSLVEFSDNKVTYDINIKWT